MNRKDFVGTMTLVGLALRRDRIKLTAWILGITLMFGLIVATYDALGHDEMMSVATMRISNAGARLFDGPVEEVTNLGQFTMLRMTVVIAIVFALMSFQTVVRHTRQNEETGCAEMIGANVVGRYASLTAALVVVLGTNLLLALLCPLALIVNGLEVGSSFAAGLGFAGVGMVFAGIAAVTAQLSSSSRGANGLAGAALGFVFLTNAVGNILADVRTDNLGVEAAWPVWLSPMGWLGQMQAFNQDNWWIMLLFISFFVTSAALAFSLVQRRDVSAGLIPPRKGPAEAPKSLLSPIGLAWRLQKGMLGGWALGMLAFGVVFGAVSDEFGQTITDIEITQGLQVSAETVLHSLVGFAATFLSIYVVSSLLRMRSEEDGGPLESVMATAVTRSKWMFSHIICSSLGALALILVFTLGMVLTAGSAADLAEFIRTVFYQWAPVMVVAGFSIAVFGLLPTRVGAVSWLAVLVSLVAGPIIGPMIDLPQGISNLSPFHHIPLSPDLVSTSNVVTLYVVAAIFIALGLVSFNRRNLSL